LALAIVSLLACRDSYDPSGLGSLALLVAVEADASSMPVDQYRAVIEGPTTATRFAAPGTVDTFMLSPGTYAVTVEGLVSGLVDVFDHHSGVQVLENRLTTVQLQLTGFRPTLDALISPTTLTQVVVSYSAVEGADNYDIEWAADAGFVSPDSKRVTETSTTITLPGFGQYFVRVQGVNALGSEGTWSNVELVDARDLGPELQRIDDLILDPFVDALLRAIDAGTESILRSHLAAIQNAIQAGDVGTVQRSLADAQSAVDASTVPDDLEPLAVLSLVFDYMQGLVP
jgi:hypothetical protein